jgi:hypothetical protein
MPMRGRREGFGARAAEGLGVAGIGGKRGVGRGRDLDALHLFVAVDGDREPYRAVGIEDRGIEGHLGAEVDGEDPALEVDGLRLAPQRRVGGGVGVERKRDVERAFDGGAVDVGQHALHGHLGRRGVRRWMAAARRATRAARPAARDGRLARRRWIMVPPITARPVE